MKFEVMVDDGASLNVLHKAREAYNHTNAGTEGFTPALDMPTYVQRLMDQAVADSMIALPVTTLAQAMTKINEIEAENAALKKEIAIPVVPAQPG